MEGIRLIMFLDKILDVCYCFFWGLMIFWCVYFGIGVISLILLCITTYLGYNASIDLYALFSNHHTKKGAHVRE